MLICFLFCFSGVENKYANDVAAVVVAVEPVATTVAAAWDFVLFCFCQLSDMGKGRLKLRKRPVFVCYCVDVCYFRGSTKVMALSPKAWVHLSSVHMRNCCRGFYFLGEARENSVCRLGGMW